MSDPFPPALPPVPVLRARAEAVEVTRAVRLAATLASDVGADLASAGTPAEGAGDGDAAAEAELRRVRAGVEAALAALEIGVRALEAFEDRAAALLARRERLDDAAERFEDDLYRDQLLPEGPARREAAAALRRRHAAFADDVAVLVADELAAEDAVIHALRAVDGAAEARRAAAAPHPDVDQLTEQLVDRLGRPDDVHVWWGRLSVAAREALVVAVPTLLVGAGGVPAADRDDAGRAALARDLEGSSGRTREGLEAVAAALGTAGLLLGYRPADGRAVVADRDPDDAEHTAVVVPGFGTDLPGIDGVASHADDLAEAVDARGEGSTAVITWVGYDAPDFHPEGVDDLVDAAQDAGGVLDEDRAEEGAAELDAFVDGLRAGDADDPSRLTVVGHSYGATTAAIAAAGGLDADAVVLLGSPGVGVGHDHVSELGAVGAAGEVYVAARDHDPVTWLGDDEPPGLGPDPAQASFGAQRIDAGEGTPFDADDLGPIGLEENHQGYLDPGADDGSLDQVAAVVGGGEPDVVAGREQPARDLLAAWTVDETARGAGFEDGDWLNDLLGLSPP